MSLREALRAVLVVIVMVTAQLTVGLELRVGGAHPELMLGLAVAAGLAGGTERGAIVGFLAGAAIDLFLPTPFGLSALVDTVIGAAAGQLVAAGVDRSSPLFVPGVAAISSVIGVMLFAVLGSVLGQPDMLTVRLAPVVGVVALTNGVLGLPLVRLGSWVFFGAEARSSVWQGSLVAGDRP